MAPMENYLQSYENTKIKKKTAGFQNKNKAKLLKEAAIQTQVPALL